MYTKIKYGIIKKDIHNLYFMFLKKYYYILLFAFFLAFPFISKGIEYDENFNPNRIISDYLLYYNTDSMNIGQIQAFLETKNSALNSMVTEDGDGNQKSSAEIIYQAAQTYQINPQAIIVLLQKEQGLIQNPNPTQKALDWATGYAVCDSCSLNSTKIQKYKGFGKQVDNAAGALRFYKENMEKYAYIKNIGEEYTINGEKIRPENYATISLYTYTPHILGNYNFWRIWQRYFGNPLAESPNDLNATIQTHYMAQIIDSAAPQLSSKENEQAWYWVEFLNIGTENWINDDLKSIYLLTEKKKDLIPLIEKTSSFDQIAIEKEITDEDKIYAPKKAIAPGEVLRFTIPIKPSYTKQENGKYVLVINGKGWLPGTSVSYELTRQFNYDAELIDDSIPEFSQENATHPINVSYKNIGLKNWSSDEIFLNWNDVTKKIQAYIPMDQDIVKPGETATFSLITKIKKNNIYKYDLNLVKKIGKEKFDDFLSGKHSATITVKNGLAAQIIDFQLPEEMKAGEEYYGRILVKNVGGITWKENEMVLRSYEKIQPFTRSVFYTKDWHSGFAVEKIAKEIKPGDTHTFNFKIKAPKKTGTYNHYYQLEWGDNYTEVSINEKVFYKKITTKVNSSDVAKKQ